MEWLALALMSKGRNVSFHYGVVAQAKAETRSSGAPTRYSTKGPAWNRVGKQRDGCPRCSSSGSTGAGGVKHL